MKNWQETFWMDESGEHKITISEVLDLLKDEPIANKRKRKDKKKSSMKPKKTFLLSNNVKI